MSNFLYNDAVDDTYNGLIDWGTASGFKVMGLNSSYTASAADHHLSDIVSGDRETLGVACNGGASFSGRKFVFSGIIFPAVTSGHTIVAVLLYHDTGTESTSRLLAYIDTAAVLPITGDGTDVTFTPDGTSGLFNT